MTDRPRHPARGRLVDANLHLLDRQVLDRDGLPVLAVDDVEIAWPGPGPTGRPQVERLLLGSGLLTRFFGARAPSWRRRGVAWRDVATLESAVHLAVDREELDLLWVERWWRDVVVARVPGGRHDPR